LLQKIGLHIPFETSLPQNIPLLVVAVKALGESVTTQQTVNQQQQVLAAEIPVHPLFFPLQFMLMVVLSLQ